MRVAVYARVSTKEQSTELQRSELLSFVSSRGWSTPLIFEDQASGTHSNRPEFRELLTLIRTRKIDVLVCWKLDRVFRSLRELTALLHEMSELGVQFISIRDQLDMTTSAGRLMTHLLGAFAEFEAAIIKERVMAGLTAARRKGKTLGRPRRIDPAAVLELRSTGLSLAQIAKSLRVTKSAVSKTLSRHPNTNPVTKHETINRDRVAE